MIIIIAGGCLARKCCFSGLRKNKDGRSAAEHEPMISKIMTVDGGLSGSLNEVFLLHFLGDDLETEGRTNMFRAWVQSLAYVVHDIEDENQDEEINQDPEGWVLKRLNSPEVRVVLVASRSVTQLLRSEMSNASCSTATSTDGGGASRSLSGKSDESLASGESGDDGIDVDSEVNLDSRHYLRVFALKHIQSHLAGNYRQLVVVSFDKHCTDGDLVARHLTPNKGPLVLPHHLSDLQHWIHSGQLKAGVVGDADGVKDSGPENC